MGFRKTAAAVAVGFALAACATPPGPPRVAACDADIAQLKHAARSGDAVAQYRLGTRYYISWLNPGMCASGKGADDAVEAYRWYTLAAGRGVEAADERRRALAGAMSRTQVAEAERRAAEWLRGTD